MNDETKLALNSLGHLMLEGTGDGLMLTMRAFRKQKTGNYEHYTLAIELPRFLIKSLAQQIASMHVRDRERLEAEAARIEREINAISEPAVKS